MPTSYGDHPTPPATSGAADTAVHHWMQTLPADRFVIGADGTGLITVTSAEITALARTLTTPAVTA